MPTFCLLLLYSYYVNNFAGKINVSLLTDFKEGILMDYKYIATTCVAFLMTLYSYYAMLCSVIYIDESTDPLESLFCNCDNMNKDLIKSKDSMGSYMHRLSSISAITALSDLLHLFTYEAKLT